MLVVLSQIMGLLWLTAANDVQDFGTCNYFTKVRPGKQTFNFTIDYPKNYSRGSKCRWVAESDRPIKMFCAFEIPFSDDCDQAALTIHDADDEFAFRYCGNRDFGLVSKSNRLVFTLVTKSIIPTGKFLCTLETEASSNEESGCSCGSKNPLRIVGGDETGIHEYPMMCALLDAHLSMIFCAATIINERQVLTAAHCLKARPVAEIKVLVGGHHLSNVTETNAANLFRVKSYAIHPLYNDATQNYDIAVVTISGRMTFGREVGPVCLPFQRSGDLAGRDRVEVLGWGSTEFAGGPSNTLQKARLSVISNVACSQTYKGLSLRQMCTQHPDKDSCQFDSGGPVLWENPATRRVVEVGIISFGGVCGDGTPAVNTRVSAFVDWIVSKTPRVPTIAPVIRLCRTPSSPPKPGSVGIGNCNQLFSRVLASTVDRKVSSEADVTSASGITYCTME